MKKYLRKGVVGMTVLSLVTGLLAPALPALAAPTPGSTWAENITANSASIRVSTSEAAYTRIEYGTSPGTYTMYYPAGSTATRGSTSSYINSTPWTTYYSLSGLSPSTTYYYRYGVCAMNAPTECINNPGTAFIYASERTFSTTAPVDSSAPASVTLAAGERTTTSIALTWTTPADTDANGNQQPPARYEVRYYENWTFGDGSWGSAATPGGALPQPGTVGSAQQFTATGLMKAGTQYCFGVKAYDAAGNASTIEGKVFCASTLSTVDSTPPPNVPLTVTEITATSVKLTWAAPSDPDANSNPQAATRYDIRYREGTGFAESDWSVISTHSLASQTPKSPGQSESISITGLKSGTSYAFALKAYDAAGNGSSLATAAAVTLPATAKTDTSIPDRVTNVSGTPSANSVSLQWLAPMDRNADGVITPVSRYEIRQKTSYSSNETEWWPTATLVPGSLTPLAHGGTQYFTVSGLSPSTMYYFSVKAYDAAGNASMFSLPVAVPTTGSTSGNASNTFPTGTATLVLQISSPAADGTAIGVNRAKTYLYSDVSCTPAGGQGAANGETDSSGRYSFPSIPQGSYKLRVEPPSDRPDLSSKEFGCVTLHQGTLHQGMMMPQTPASSSATLSITVREPGGAAVGGARVEACGPTAASACATLEAGTVNGTYILRNAQAGTYTLRAYPPSSRSDLSMISDSVTVSGNTSGERTMTLPKSTQTQPTPNGGSWPQSKAECDNYYGLWCPPTGSMSMGSCMMAGQSCSTMNSQTCWNGAPTSSGCPPMPQTESACKSAGLYWCTWSGGTGGCSMMQCMPSAPAGMMTCPDGKTFKATISECPKKTQTTPEPTPEPGSTPQFSNVWSGAITQSFAMIYYSIDRPATVTLEYKQKLDEPWMGAGSQTIVAGDTYSNRTLSLPGLKSGTTYFYRLTANTQGITSSYPGPNVPPAQFVTAFETTSGSSLPKGTATLTIIVQDEKGIPVNNATVGLSTCGANTYFGAMSGGGAAPYTPCAWASSPTSASGLVAFTDIAGKGYTLGVSPAWSGGVQNYEYVTDRYVSIAEGEKKTENITLKKIGSGVVTDLPLTDIRMEHMPQGFGFETWVRWYTPRPASGHIEYGLSEAYELPPVGLPGFSSYHEGKLQLKPETLYYYRLKSHDDKGVAGSASGTFMTPKAGGDDNQMPFGIAWNKVNPNPGSALPLTDAIIRLEFTKPVAPSSLTKESVVFAGADKTKIAYALEPFSNGVTVRIQEKLKANTSYSLSVNPSVKSLAGTALAYAQYLNFYTGSGDYDQRGAGSITGAVKLLNGTGVQGATVVAHGGMIYQKQVTNEKGEYTISGLPVGVYELSVYLPSFLGDYIAPRLPNVTIAGDGSIMRQDIVLAPSDYVIQGLIAHEDGTPVTDALVGAYQTSGGRYVPPMPVDDQGHFKLLVSEGTWFVGVMHRGINVPCDPKGPCPMTSSIPYVMPGWNIPEKQTVTLDESAKVRNVYFKVTKYAFEGTVRGVVARKDGKDIDTKSTRVRIAARGGTKVFSQTIELANDGSFRAAMPPGLYDLFIETADPDVSAPPAIEVRISGQEIRDLGTILLASTNVTIKGAVRNELGKGVSGLTVSAWNKESGTTLSETTGNDGGYIIKVSRGDWIVYVASSDKYASSYGGTVFISASQLPAKGIDFTVQETMSYVRGTIVNTKGERVSDASGYVSARPTGKGESVRRGFFGGSPVSNGEFSLTLPAGSYALEFEPPQNSRYIPKKKVSLAVKAGQTVSASIEVEDARETSTATLSGTLTDARGVPIANTPFTVYAGAKNQWYSAIGDATSGAYSLSLPAGTWYVGYQVNDPLYSKAQFRGASVTLKEGEQVSRNFAVFRASAKISGKTLDENGTPIPNVSVMIWGRGANSYTESVYSDQDGSFEVYLEPGTYAVRATIGAESGLLNPEEQTLTLSDGADESLALTFAPGEIVIKGKTVIRGKAVPATVWAWSEKRGMKEIESDGSFSLAVAANDVWRFSAVTEVDRCEYRADNTSLAIDKKEKAVTLTLTSSKRCLSEPVTVESEANKPVVVEHTDGVRVAAPAHAAANDGTVNVSITPEAVPQTQGSERIVGQSYDIRLRAAGSDIKSFNSDLTVTLPYKPSDVRAIGASAKDLSMKYWDGSAWHAVKNCFTDTNAQTVTCSVDHATRFAIVAPVNVPSPKASANVRGTAIMLAIGAYNKKDITGVNVYRSEKFGDLGGLIAQKVTMSTFTDKNVQPGTKYFYTVRGVGTAGNESLSKKQVSATIPAPKAKKVQPKAKAKTPTKAIKKK